MFSVHIEILLWYGMFRVAGMLLISMAFGFVQQLQLQQAKEVAAVSRTQLEEVTPLLEIS